MTNNRVRFIPVALENGMVLLRLHFEGDIEPDLRKLLYHDREGVERAFDAAGLPGLKVCTVETSGKWDVTEKQIQVLTSMANEIRL